VFVTLKPCAMWYRRLDQLAETSSTADFATMTAAFESERLILTDDGSWATSSSVFLSSDDEDVPGASRIRPAVADLGLWRRLGVAERPTIELALSWLQSLPSGQVLSATDAHRARAIMSRYPVRVWDVCAHWLNLTGAWVPAETLKYADRRASAFQWAHLFPWVKDRTALLTGLAGEVDAGLPFAQLVWLTDAVDERLDSIGNSPGQPETREWLNEVGALLARAQFDADDVTRSVRALGSRLARTRWRTTASLTVTPYLGGTPAGTPKEVDVLWTGTTLYVRPMPSAKLARRVPEEVAGMFGRPDVQGALAYSYERPLEDIRAYLEENFRLVSPNDEEPETSGDESSLASVAERAMDSSASPRSTGVVTRPDSPLNERAHEPRRIDGDTGSTDSRPEEWVRSRGSHPRRPSLIERFAVAFGFEEVGPELYIHPDGRSLARDAGGGRWWSMSSTTGEHICSYRPIDHCLELTPLELDAETWTLLERNPATYALMLADARDEPIEVTGSRLIAMRAGGTLTLYPALYRLVVSDGATDGGR
jgi:hypothetical protein